LKPGDDPVPEKILWLMGKLRHMNGEEHAVLDRFPSFGDGIRSSRKNDFKIFVN
jgi:hypothetical protein